MLEWQDVDRGTWRNLLDELPHDFYDLFEYLELDSVANNGDVLALAARLDGRQLLLPLVVRPIPVELSRDCGLVDARSPYGYPGILYPPDIPEVSLSSLLQSVQAMGCGRGIVSTFLRLHPTINESLCSVVGFSGVEIVRRGLTVSTDLSVPAGELESRIRENHRRNVKKLRDNGFSVRFDSWGDYPEFQRLYRETMERNNASRHLFFGEEYFDALTRILGSRLHLCSVITPDNLLAAAGLFVRTGGLVQYHLGASSAKYLRLAPSKLMFYAAIRWFQDEGASRLHLGGGLGSTADSLYEFKRGFGTDIHSFSVVHIIHDPKVYGRLVDLRAKLENGREPSPDFFPAYRA